MTSSPTRHDEELAQAVCEIAVCLAQAVHAIDPQAAQRMNFAAGKAFNRMLEEDRALAAEVMLRFGRALVDRSLFPRDDDAADREPDELS